MIELEIAAIGARLSPGSSVLDVGCASGYSSLRYVIDCDVALTGIDFVPEMIEAARIALAALPHAARSRARFAVGDATRLEFADEAFDVVVSTRVMINLPDRERQQQALSECARVLRPGGHLLLSEATVQGWRRLNKLRSEWGLDDIPMPSFNRYLDEDDVRAVLQLGLDLEETVNFASSYYVATRVVKPLLASVAATPIDVADPDAEFNRWAALLPPAGDYGTQKLFVFRKR